MSKSILILALWLIAELAPAQGIEQGIIDAVYARVREEYEANKENYLRSFSEAFAGVWKIDMNGDGIKEAVVRLDQMLFCGMKNCYEAVLQEKNGKWEVVAETGGDGHFAFIPAKRKGEWGNLVVSGNSFPDYYWTVFRLDFSKSDLMDRMVELRKLSKSDINRISKWYSFKTRSRHLLTTPYGEEPKD